MADFCQECSNDIFGEDFGDLKGLCQTGFVSMVICEGCGPTYVDSDGRCAVKDCLQKHRLEEPNERPSVEN